MDYKSKLLKYKNKIQNIHGGSTPTKIKVIIIPEDHTVIGQQTIQQIIPFLQEHILKKLKIKDTEILNYSEGNHVATFYNKMYKIPDLIKLQHVCEDGIDTNIEEYKCIKHGLALINLLLGTLDYYKELRKTKPDEIPIGLDNLRMNEKYIGNLVYKQYEYTLYIPDKKHRFYAYVNAAYQNIIKNESNEKYEEYIIGLLNECRPFLNACSKYFDYNPMIDEYIEAKSIENRNKLYLKYSSLLRKLLDIRTITKIPNIIKKVPEIKLLIILCGVNHFYNLHELIKESSIFEMESEFLEYINHIYDLAGIKTLRTGPS
jgi:hypothetical protein